MLSILFSHSFYQMMHIVSDITLPCSTYYSFSGFTGYIQSGVLQVCGFTGCIRSGVLQMCGFTGCIQSGVVQMCSFTGCIQSGVFQLCGFTGCIHSVASRLQNCGNPAKYINLSAA